MYKPTGFIALPMLGLLVVVAAAIAVGSWWIAGKEEAVAPTISNFAECAAAGNPVMESYPRQCAANGQTFVEVIANANTAASSNTNATTNVNATVNGNTNTSADPTAGWKMVMNTSGKYTLRYPVGWQATVSTTMQGRTSIKPSNYDEKAQIELAPDFVATVVASVEPAASAGATSKEIADLDCNQNRKTITVNGIQSLQQDQSCFATWVSTYIPRSDGKYILISWPEVFEDEYPEFEQILSTFTFLDETVGWKTYTNSDIGYTIKYPSSWSVKEANVANDPIRNQPVRYLTIANASTKSLLLLGVRKVGSNVLLNSRTGVGAGDFNNGAKVTVAGKVVQTHNLTYQGKVKEVWYFGFSDMSPEIIQGYEVQPELSSSKEYDSVDLVNSPDYQTVNTMLGTLQLGI